VLITAPLEKIRLQISNICSLIKLRH